MNIILIANRVRPSLIGDIYPQNIYFLRPPLVRLLYAKTTIWRFFTCLRKIAENNIGRYRLFPLEDFSRKRYSKTLTNYHVILAIYQLIRSPFKA